MDRIVVWALWQISGFTLFDITESGTRPTWFNADCDKLVCLLGHVRSQSQCFLKDRPICNDVIGWKDNHDGCMIAHCHPAGPERNRRCGVALGWLGYDVFLREISQQLANCAFLFCVR